MPSYPATAHLATVPQQPSPAGAGTNADAAPAAVPLRKTGTDSAAGAARPTRRRHDDDMGAF